MLLVYAQRYTLRAMPIPAGLVKIVLGGDMPGGEIWESGFWMSGTGVDSEATANALALVIDGTLTATDSSGALNDYATTVWSAQVTFRYTRVYAYTGGTTAAYIGVYERTTPLTGGGNPGMPNQTCSVVSLRTGGAGRRRRGRMYLPVNAPGPLTATGELQASTVRNLSTSWATAFSDIGSSSAGKIIVLSQVGGSDAQVTNVIVSSRLDVQRRRANQQSVDETVSSPLTQ